MLGERLPRTPDSLYQQSSVLWLGFSHIVHQREPDGLEPLSYGPRVTPVARVEG
jgi:hypothetical protein